jgi:hypothetical protein
MSESETSRRIALHLSSSGLGFFAAAAPGAGSAALRLKLPTIRTK